MLSSPGVSEVPVEATAFLGAVAAFVVFLFVLFLYLNKKLCFYTVGGFPCCDDPVTKPDKLKELGAAYNYGEGESSSDSEEEVSNRLATSKSFPSALRDNHHNHVNSNHVGSNHHNHTTSNHHNHANHTPSSYHTYNHYGHHNYHQLGPSRSSSQYSAPEDGGPPDRGDGCVCDPNTDLISLAEKGRAGVSVEEEPVGVGVGVSSSSASSSGSTTSGDDDLLTHRALRHRDPRAYRQMSPNRSPYDGTYHQECREDGSVGEALLVRCGTIEAGFAYDLPTKTLTVHILQAKDVPSKERGGAANTQVRVLLLPARKQKHKTRIRPGDNPQFNEAFVFTKINPEEVQQLGVRLRLYGCERMRREKMVGEVIVPFASINLTLGNTFWLTLEPRANLARTESRTEVCSLTRSDSTGSNHSVHSGVPELLVGLTYNGTTGRLAVEVIKGSHFSNDVDSVMPPVLWRVLPRDIRRVGPIMRNMANTRAPDTYVKLVLMSSSGQEIAHSKTSVRRGQPNPLFKETFMFQVALFQLPDVTLMASVYTKRSMKRKDMIGWFALGLNSSGEEELAHWNQMRDSKGEQVCRWHVLLES
ncbi:synaptotagmin-14-like isoform X2 [Homarus americanus]|uniref:synaptotagmin-14-like isoform X2 n=1 Tax=Homarus americanus TaxID=6706 RepID=UPI001C43F73C|nr:synaptotagmin-14-like isoform X2 [Homarus americanus]